MGSFHCPLSIKEYKAEGCIDCGLCQAKDMKESLEASKKMEEYLRSVRDDSDTRPVSKICITGKGGVGKSTVSSVFARIFADKGYEVLVIDTDESNPSLYRKLGMEKEPKELITFLDRYNLEYGIPEDTWLSKDDILFEDIPDEFVERDGNILLMETGKIRNSFQGCACSMADFARQLMKNLRPVHRQVVIADLEAGVESFGRGIEQGADTIITLTETSYDSVRLAEQIKRMANAIGIRRVYTLFNRIPDEDTKKMIEAAKKEYDINHIGTLDYEKSVMESGFNGSPVPGDSECYRTIEKLIIFEEE